MDIKLTEQAAKEIQKVISHEGLDAATIALRVDVEVGGPGKPGGGYMLDLVPTWSDAEDEVDESQGVRLVCRKEKVGRLKGVTVDFREKVTGRGFIFDRPSEPRDTGEVQSENPPTESEVRAALNHVINPEVGLNIVDLGLMYGITIEDRRVHLTMTMTTPACPLSEHIKQDARQSVLAHCSGATDVDIELVWEPPWGPHMMSEEAKKQMGWAGV